MAKTIFTMPKGDSEFDEMEVGEKMSFSGTLRKEEDGKACLVSVDGKTVPGYSDSEDGEEEAYEEGETEGEEGAMGDMASALNEML